MEDQTPRYTDREIVEGILEGNQQISSYFFCTQCKSVVYYIYTKICDGRYQPEEIVNILFLYLSENNWHKLRQFDYRSKLTTWLSVVAVRYFKKMLEGMIETASIDTLYSYQADSGTSSDRLESVIDVRAALMRMPNSRYRYVIEALDIREIPPEDLAKEMNITTANLYNIHRRALQQLKAVMM